MKQIVRTSTNRALAVHALFKGEKIGFGKIRNPKSMNLERNQFQTHPKTGWMVLGVVLFSIKEGCLTFKSFAADASCPAVLLRGPSPTWFVSFLSVLETKRHRPRWFCIGRGKGGVALNAPTLFGPTFCKRGFHKPPSFVADSV